MESRSVLPRITIFVLLLIVSIVVIARVSLATKEEHSKETFSQKEVIYDNRLNGAENVVLNMLLGAITDSGHQEDIDNCKNYLVNYLCKEEIDLKMETANKVSNKLQDFIALRNLEQESDVRNMSLDGRGVAIHIIQQAYILAGIQIDFSIQGDIRQLTDSLGNDLHKENSMQINEVIYVNPVLIIFAIWTSLFYVCIYIAKKKRLYIKDGEYEFDKKGFA